MADIFWIKGGADAHWDTHTGNWFDDAAGLVQASDGPQDDDYAYLTGATAPDNGPAVAVSLIGLDASALADDVTITSGVTVTGRQTLVLGVRGGTEVHTWEGDGTESHGAVIQGASVVSANIGSEAIFRDTAYIDTGALFGERARFFDDAEAGAGTFSTSVYCYGNNYFYAIDDDLTLTGVTFYVHRFLTLGIAGYSIIGTPTIIMMSRNAQFNTAGPVVANVVLYRLAQVHRLRHLRG